jgi:hypothetical protein
MPIDDGPMAETTILMGKIDGTDQPPPFWVEESLYSPTRVAQHPESGLIQVWVECPTPEAVTQFLAHYPSFVEQEGFTVERPQEWVQMAHPFEATGATPMENFRNGAARIEEQSRSEEAFVLASTVVNPLREL